MKVSCKQNMEFIDSGLKDLYTCGIRSVNKGVRGLSKQPSNAFLLFWATKGAYKVLRKEGETRIPSGCAISGMISHDGSMICGQEIVRSIATMHDRSNGLGGGFAGYGIYPQYKEHYALHLFYDDANAKAECEAFLERHFDIINLSRIPVRKTPKITNEPLIWRYFVQPLPTKLSSSHLDEEKFVARCVFRVNVQIKGAYVFSSGKNMGVFKAAGYPEDVGAYYRLDEYEGYLWTAHGRYPTNTPGWWGGAHPFALLDRSIVHNGEISSYDANRRFMEMFGYSCTLLTDTEVITYIFDHLLRKQGFTLQEAASIVAAPFWSRIDQMRDEEEKQRLTYLRGLYSSLLITGPFSILLGFSGGMMALNDRLKLRSMVVAKGEKRSYVASEECAIRVLDESTPVFSPKGGEPVLLYADGREAL